MRSPIATSEKCTAGTTSVPARNSPIKVKTRVPQVSSIYMPIMRRMLDVLRVSFIVGEFIRAGHQKLAIRPLSGYTASSNNDDDFVTVSNLSESARGQEWLR